jgi:uncharacterized protein (TIGR02246 family)
MNIRTLRIIVLLLMSSVSVVLSQEGEIAARKLLTDQVTTWNAGDVEGFMKGYWNSDSTEFVSGGNIVRGYRQVLARYKKTYDTREKMGKLEFADLQIRTISPKFVLATGVWKLYRAKDQPWGRFTLLIEKKSEGWRIIHDHTSSAN